MRKLKLAFAGAVLMALAATAPSAVAQQTGPDAAERSQWRERGGEIGHGMLRGGPSGPFCGGLAGRRIEMMLRRLERITNPREAQRAIFQRLVEAADTARETIRAACPDERPITPPGRLAAAEKRLEALLQAVRTIRPALDEYYGSLSEEQKARLYAAGARPDWRPRDDRWQRWQDRRDRGSEDRGREERRRPWLDDGGDPRPGFDERGDRRREEWRSRERGYDRGEPRWRNEERLGRDERGPSPGYGGGLGRGDDEAGEEDESGWLDPWRGPS